MCSVDTDAAVSFAGICESDNSMLDREMNIFWSITVI